MQYVFVTCCLLLIEKPEAPILLVCHMEAYFNQRWETTYMFDAVWTVPWITHVMFLNLKDHFGARKDTVCCEGIKDPKWTASSHIIILLCLNSGSASFKGRIWRPITSQRRAKAVLIWRLLQMQPTNAPSFPSFQRMHRYYPTYPKRQKKKKEREKMASSRGVDRHIRRPGRHKLWRKGKTPGDATRKCSKG